MRDDDGFTAAEGWIDEWEAGVVAYAARADDLARRLSGPREDGAREDGPREEGPRENDRAAQVRRIVAETVGLDSALGRAVVEGHG